MKPAFAGGLNGKAKVTKTNACLKQLFMMFVRIVYAVTTVLDRPG
jgi:hypothetical protein